MWYMNFHNIRQKNVADCAFWCGVFKVHKKSIHQLKFSVDGNMLLVGSDDGTATLWQMTPFVARLTTLLEIGDKINNIHFEDLDFSDNLIYKFDHMFEYKDPKRQKPEDLDRVLIG